MGLWLAWLAKIAKNPKFVKWLVAELGPNALGLFGAWLARLRHRQTAIDEADQIDGHFSAAIIDGKRHVVVWKDGTPVSAYPPLASGDLQEKLRHHSREGLKDPDDLPTQRAARWIANHVPYLHEGTDDPDGRQRFDAAINRMQPLLDELQQAPRHRVADHPSIPAAPGIYLFSSHEVPIYVGQSRNLRKRLTQHTDSNSGRDQASFAFNLAKRSALEAGVPLTGSRSAVESLPEFAAHFDHARTEVADMELQFIELPDTIERSLFEIYAALTLGTDEFNSFETH